jgi:hypothetical protein
MYSKWKIYFLGIGIQMVLVGIWPIFQKVPIGIPIGFFVRI